MPVEDRVDRRLGRARLVGILDPQQEFAAMMAGEQPVEQRGARAADMEEAGRRGRETRHDGGAGRFGQFGGQFGLIFGCHHGLFHSLCRSR